MYDKGETYHGWLAKLYDPSRKYATDESDRIFIRAGLKKDLKDDALTSHVNGIMYNYIPFQCPLIVHNIKFDEEDLKDFNALIDFKTAFKTEEKKVAGYFRRLLNIAGTTEQLYYSVPNELRDLLLPNIEEWNDRYVSRMDYIKFNNRNKIYVDMIKQRVVINMLRGD